MAEKEHKLHGRTIDPKVANPRQVNKKVFVGRLDPSITEDEVRAYFETFGPVSLKPIDIFVLNLLENHLLLLIEKEHHSLLMFIANYDKCNGFARVVNLLNSGKV